MKKYTYFVNEGKGRRKLFTATLLLPKCKANAESYSYHDAASALTQQGDISCDIHVLQTTLGNIYPT